MSKQGGSFALTKTTRSNAPKLPYEKMKDRVLGRHYELSLVFIGKDRARTLNKKSRKKNYIPNVLAFPLAKDAGEIFICLQQAKREARDFAMSNRDFIAYLFIHALLHLKGHPHGATMERKEQELLRHFGITGSR